MKNIYKAFTMITALTMLSFPVMADETETTGFAMYMLSDEERGSEASDEGEDEGKVDITMEADVPDDFHMKIDVYFNDIPMGLFYDETKERNGYINTVPIAKGVYDVKVFSKADFADEFSYSVSPEVLDTSKDKNIKISVKPTANHYQEEEENDDLGHLHDDSSGMAEIEPELIDLSEGKKSGTFRVSLVDNEPALKSVTYTLTDGKKNYPIELKRDYLFSADVLLPVGEYHELRNLDYVLDDDAAMNDEIKVTWSHAYNRSFFGNYYTIIEDNTTILQDLELMMVLRGDVFPFDSQMLYSVTLKERKSEAIKAHGDSVMESLGIKETTAEETQESPTIAELVPVEDTTNMSIRKILAITGLALMVLFASIALVIKIKNRNE